MNKQELRGPKNFSDLAIAGGCGSSGSTLLTHLVSKHPAIVSGPEFNFFNHPQIYDKSELVASLKKLLRGHAIPAGYVDVPVFMTFRDYYGFTETDIIALTNESANEADFIGAVVSRVVKKLGGGDLFFEKSPTNSYCFDVAARSLPGVKLVHTVRDGRDVVCSLMRRGWNLFGAGSRWLFDTAKCLEARRNPNYFEIRYESLVTDTSNQLTNLLSFLAVDGGGNELLEPVNDDAGYYTEDWTARSEPRVWNQTPSDPISAKSVGKYKAVLSRKELNLLHRIRLGRGVKTGPDIPRSFGDMLAFLGYDCNYEREPFEIGLLDRGILEGDDYLRRVRRFVERKQFYVPKRLTKIG